MDLSMHVSYNNGTTTREDKRVKALPNAQSMMSIAKSLSQVDRKVDTVSFYTGGTLLSKFFLCSGQVYDSLIR
jgi:hypothetical protein